MKIKVVSNIFEILIFIPPNPFILKDLAEEELKLDIIPYYGYNFDFTLNLFKENEENKIIEYQYNKGSSVYQISNENLINLECNQMYYFTITKNSNQNYLYKQKIIFSNMKIEHSIILIIIYIFKIFIKKLIF